MERVRRKLTILLLVSSGIMLVGFLAVVIAVFYRVSKMSEEAPGAVVDLPVAAQNLTSTVVTDDRITLTIGGDEPRIEVRELPSGDLLTTFRLTGPAPAAPTGAE